MRESNGTPFYDNDDLVMIQPSAINIEQNDSRQDPGSRLSNQKSESFIHQISIKLNGNENTREKKQKRMLRNQVKKHANTVTESSH